MFVAVRCLTRWASQKIHDCRISHLIPLRLCHPMSSDSYFPIFTQEASAMCNGGSLVDLISHHWCFCWCGYVEECQVANKLCTHSPLLHCAPSPAYNSGKWQKLVDNSPFLLRKEILGGNHLQSCAGHFKKSWISDEFDKKRNCSCTYFLLFLPKDSCRFTQMFLLE